MSKTAYATAVVSAILSIGLQYVWIFGEKDFTIFILGFPLVPAILLPALPPLVLLLRSRKKDLVDGLKKVGAIRFWLGATILPLTATGVVYLYAMSAASDFGGTAHYNALVISSALDLPLLFLLCVPLLAAQEIAWRLLLREKEVGYAGAFLSSIFWSAANGALVACVFRLHGPAVAGAFLLFLFALGFFLALLHARGSLYASIWSLFLVLISTPLLFENRIPLINKVLFGGNNLVIEGLLCINEVPYTAPLLLLAAFYLGAGFVLRLIPLRKV